VVSIEFKGLSDAFRAPHRNARRFGRRAPAGIPVKNFGARGGRPIPNAFVPQYRRISVKIPDRR
jgi:hypothetical protein